MTRFASATVCAAVCFLLYACASGFCEDSAAPATPATPPPDSALSALVKTANEAQRDRAHRFLVRKYPTFSLDVWQVIMKACPDFSTAVWPHMDMLIRTKYASVAEVVGKLLRGSPQMQQAVAGLILDKYPELVDEIRQVATSPDPGTAVQKLIRDRHPRLLTDILAVLQQQHPRLLADIERLIVVQYPGLIADVADLLTAKYPELPDRIRLMMAERYPTLAPELLQVLAQPAAEPVPGEASEPKETAAAPKGSNDTPETAPKDAPPPQQ